MHARLRSRPMLAKLPKLLAFLHRGTTYVEARCVADLKAQVGAAVSLMLWNPVWHAHTRARAKGLAAVLSSRVSSPASLAYDHACSHAACSLA